jgi:hypothetical protein
MVLLMKEDKPFGELTTHVGCPDLAFVDDTESCTGDAIGNGVEPNAILSNRKFDNQ